MPSFHANSIGVGGTLLTTPAADGQAGEVIKTDGAGVLSFGNNQPIDGDKGEITVSNAGLTWVINALAVTATKIGALAVTTAKIDNLAVTTAKIADLNVTTGKIAALAVTTAKLADNGVTTEKINALAVTTAKIAGEAVTSDQLATDAVTTGKIADQAVEKNKIATDAVETRTIAPFAVTDAELAADAVITAKILDANVTAAKLAATGVAPDTYLSANIIVDAQGRITAAANGLSLAGDNLWTGENSFTQSIDAMAGMNASAGAIHFGTTERAGTGNSQTLSLTVTNHHTVLATTATANVSVTLTQPLGPASGSIVVHQGATPRDITWTAGGAPILWLGFEPTWSDVSEANGVRIVSYRWDGNAMYLTATERN